MKLLLSFLITFFATNGMSALSTSDKTQFFEKNLLVNGGFESGRGSWTASAGTFASTTTSPMIGGVHVTWDAAASADTLTSVAVAIPVGMYGRSGVASCLITTPSGTATHSIQAYDGTNILSSVAITSSTIPSRSSANFVFPSSGNISLRIYANANEPSISIDDCYLGAAEGFNASNISQTVFIGSAYFVATTSCQWTSTASYADFNTTAACPGLTVESNPGPGTISTTDADLPQMTVNNLPPGVYKVEARFWVDASANKSVRLSDGTTAPPSSYITTGTTANYATVTGIFTYTSAGNRTFRIQASTAGVTVYSQPTIVIDSGMSFKIYRLPLSSEQAYRPDMLANSWSGYHDSTCSWARTNAAYGDPTADASCALVERTNSNFGTVSTSGSVLPAITFTPKKAGRYYVCALADILSNNINASAKLWDGTTTIVERGFSFSSASQSQIPLCGIYNASSTATVTLSIQTKSATGTVTIQTANAASAVEWSIVEISQSIPAPLLANSVVSSSNGVVKINSATLNCAAGSSIASQEGNWVSSIGNVSAGACVITLANGIYSSTPRCTANGTGANQIVAVTPASSTSVTVQCISGGGTNCASWGLNMICVGAP